MKRNILTIAATLAALSGSWGQQLPADKNYIRTRTYMNNTATAYTDDVTYYDGFGLPFETVNINFAGGKNLFSLTEYNILMQENLQHLPVPAAAATTYMTPATLKTTINQSALYTGSYRYYETEYERTPMQRPVASHLPGNEMRTANASTKLAYKTNEATGVLACKKFTVTGTMTGTALALSGNYAAGTLHVTETKDGDGKLSYEFTDKQGQVVLTRQINGTQYLDTYYVYDPAGNLSYVLPPELSRQATVFTDTNALMMQFAYMYKYDERRRVVEKKLPGAAWEYFVYDKADKLIMWQDGNLRAVPNRWKFTLYDNHDRPTQVWQSTAITLTRAQLQTNVSSQGQAYLNNYKGVLLEHYLYDKYNHSAQDIDHTKLGFAAVSGVVTAADNANMVNGLLTYERRRVVEDRNLTTNRFTDRAYYYDTKGQTVQIVEVNHLGGTSRTSFKYDFTGNVLTKHESHQMSATAAADVLLSTYTYDNRGRILTETTTLNGAGKAVLKYAYNDLGQLASKTYGEGTAAVAENYAYNMQGWLTDKKSALFDMTLRYYDKQKTTTMPSYTGNITEWEWQHKGSGTTGVPKYTYTFKYDNLSRLTDSDLYENASASPVTKFVEKGLTYDYNGNIKTLRRYSSTGALVDNFIYNYTGNQLTSLTGSHSATYTYDTNGNMIKDGLENVTLGYNYMNLVDEVKSGTTLKAKYRWLADGTKAGVNTNAASTGDGYEYLGSLVYTRKAGALALESAAFGGGRIIKGTAYAANYFITDHLGSPRVVFTTNTSIMGRHDYLPFGQAWQNPAMQTGTNRYLYNEKEKQVTGGLSYLDYGARFYDARTVVWNRADRFAQKYYGSSPYAYVLGNPIKNIDINGDSTNVYIEEKGGGHVWISTGEGEAITVYDYGRYGGTYNKSGLPNDRSGSLKNGPGVLRVLSGQEAVNYNLKKESETSVYVYTILDVSDEVIDNIAMSIYEGGSKINDNARYIDEYSLTGNNCSTFVSELLNKAGSMVMSNTRHQFINQGTIRISVGNQIFLPKSMNQHLNKMSGNSNPVVIKR